MAPSTGRKGGSLRGEGEELGIFSSLEAYIGGGEGNHGI